MNNYKALLPFMIILIAWSCEKGSDDIVKNTHRIKEYVYDHQNNMNDSKQEFDYENEKLVRIKYYVKDESNNWQLDSKDTITYSEGMFTSTNFILTGGVFHSLAKLEMKIENELITEEKCFVFNDEGSWDKHWATIYQYSGKNLSKWFYYFDEDNDHVTEAKLRGTYTYTNGLLQEILIEEESGYEEITSWWPSDKIRYNYSEGQLINLYKYRKSSNTWLDESKIEFSYLYDLISETDLYGSQNGQWIFQNNIAFDYDEFGNWSSCTTGDYTITNVYEDGHGNATYFFYDAQDLNEGPTIKRAVTNSHMPVPYIKKTFKDLIDLN